MTQEKENRAKWHLGVAVCRTKGGLKIHLGLIGLEDLQILMIYLHCALEELTEKCWSYIKDGSKVCRHSDGSVAAW